METKKKKRKMKGDIFAINMEKSQLQNGVYLIFYHSISSLKMFCKFLISTCVVFFFFSFFLL
uniref:Uncharacterized protein n=1 Tax=Onchocerca volvulus TaxID=6282 RepID=A0A8R1XUU4_ONCVO